MPLSSGPFRRLWQVLAIFGVLGLGAGAGLGVEALPGPIPAFVTEVIDGDTVSVRARIWLGQDVQIRVRLLNIDTPELRGKCSTERSLAIQARDQVIHQALGRQVQLWEVAYGKYAGRVTARITLEDGTDLSAYLVSAGLARPYDGGVRGSWCPPVPGGN